MMKNIKLIIVIIICSLLIAINANTAENKILLKINNQIIKRLAVEFRFVALDLFTEAYPRVIRLEHKAGE